MTNHLHEDAAAIWRELRSVPEYAFPPGQPSSWTDYQCELAIHEGEDDSPDWIKRRQRLIDDGTIE